jgi:ankyrin repeat protein
LAKPERDQLFDQIQAELESCGNDLSSIGDGEFPYGNFNDPKLLRLLLKAGLPLEVTDTKGNSLLIQAAVNPQCLELVLKNGADVNRKCESYNATTALFRAASLGKRKSVEVLLQHGADPTIKDKSGRSAADVVDKRSRERQAIIDLLR